MVAVLLEASGGRGEVDPTSEPPTRPQSQAAGPSLDALFDAEEEAVTPLSLDTIAARSPDIRAGPSQQLRPGTPSWTYSLPRTPLSQASRLTPAIRRRPSRAPPSHAFSTKTPPQLPPWPCRARVVKDASSSAHIFIDPPPPVPRSTKRAAPHLVPLYGEGFRSMRAPATPVQWYDLAPSTPVKIGYGERETAEKSRALLRSAASRSSGSIAVWDDVISGQREQPPIRLADAAHGASLAALDSPAYAVLRACASLPTVGRGQQWSLASGNVWRMDNTRPSRGRGFFTVADLAASVPRTSAIGL